jgi:ATP-binding cassette subfamily B protein
VAEYFESDPIVRAYDPRLTGRLFGLLKPHSALAVLCLFALAAMTLGQLVLPFLLQRAVDRYILPDYRRLEPGAAAAAWPASSADAFVVGAWTFVPAKDLAGRSAADPDAWLVLRPPSAGHAVAAYPAICIGGPAAAAIRRADYVALPSAVRFALRGSDVAAVAALAWVYALALAAVFAASFVQTWSAALIGQGAMRGLRLRLHEWLADQSLAYLSSQPIGRLVTRLTGDVETVNEFFTTVLASFLADFALMAGVLVALVLLSPALAVPVLLSLPPAAVLTVVVRGRARDAFRRQRAATARLNAYLAERLAGVRIVQSFCRERASAAEFAERDGELLDANLGEMYVVATFRPIVDFLSSLTLAVVLLAGGRLILKQDLSIGVVIAFINLTQMFYGPVQDISDKYALLQSAMAGAERAFGLLDRDERSPDPSAGAAMPPVRGAIEFSGVEFAYKPGEPVLRDLSFRVAPGELVALVGYTGSGKTTVGNLLTRLWDPQAGRITLDGKDLADYPLAGLRRAVVPVSQDVFLFAGTIADNIRLGAPIDDAAVEAAARAVAADGFIRKLPDGYRTRLSEGASNLSSGQRQLIGFARVIARDPAVVILDEATSSIDTATEAAVQEGLAKVLENRSALVIAHRLSTIRHADRILVLASGRLVEQGRHQELLDLAGVYAELYRLQYGKHRT